MVVHGNYKMISNNKVENIMKYLQEAFPVVKQLLFDNI